GRLARRRACGAMSMGTFGVRGDVEKSHRQVRQHALPTQEAGGPVYNGSMKALATVVISAALLAHAAVAWADESAAESYKRGRAELKAGRIHEACRAFETSLKLEAKLDTEIALAGCYEQDGKPLSAAKLYRST